jgi:serine/threonine protein kinase
MRELSGKTVWGKYRIGDRIGGDRAGSLHEAHDLGTKSKVALVALADAVQVDPDTSSSAAHPNLVVVQDVLEKDGTAKFVVTEMPPGKSLEAVLAKRGKLELGAAVATAMQVLSALHSIHDRERVHGNMCAGNVFLDKDDEGMLSAAVVDAGLVEGSGLKGEYRYQAPEQVVGEWETDRRTDIWAVGVLIHEMLLGKPPFTGKNTDEITGKILLKDPELPEPGEIPEEVLGFIKRALQKEPDDRYQNVTAAIGDLLFLHEELEETMPRAIAAALRESIAPPPPPPQTQKGAAKPKKKAKPVGLPSALDLFGKKDPKKEPAAGPKKAPPLPAGPVVKPPPLPEKMPEDAGMTMPIPKDKKDPAPAPEAKEIDVDVDEERETEPTGEHDVKVPDEFRDSEIEGRTTLPAPSGVFEQLDKQVAEDDDERATVPTDSDEARRPDASPTRIEPQARPQPTKAGGPSKLTLVVGGIAALAVVGFVAVLIYAFGGQDNGPAEPTAENPTADPPEQPVAAKPEKPLPPEQPEPEQPAPEQPEPEQPAPEQPEPEQPAPEQPEPEQPATEPAADDKITLTLIGVPDNAIVKINGVRTKAPIQLPKSQKPITLGVYLTGHHSHWERFSPLKDREIEIKLPKKGKGGGSKGGGQPGSDKGGKGGKGGKGTWADNPWGQ